MSETVEPPETHPAHRVEVDSGSGPTVEFQAVPFDDPCCEAPYADFTFKVSGGDNDLVFSYRALLSDAEMGAMIGALSCARADARRQAALFGWSPPV